MERISPTKEYKYYHDPEAREQLFNEVKVVAEYIHDQKIPNIILPDRSARNFYVPLWEYWKTVYPDDKKPNIYFTSPGPLFSGFFYVEPEGPEGPDVAYDMDNTYKHLVRDSALPLLVYDTCMHSGDTILKIKKRFTNMGFNDIRIGVSSKSHGGNIVDIDLVASSEALVRGCYPFGKGSLVQRPSDGGVLSTRNDYTFRGIENVQRAKDERGEMKRIIVDGLARQ